MLEPIRVSDGDRDLPHADQSRIAQRRPRQRFSLGRHDADNRQVGVGIGPDTIRNVARSVIGRNAFDTEAIFQAAFMDGFYSPGKERLHAIGAIDLALWDIKGKALGVPVYELLGGPTRTRVRVYAHAGTVERIKQRKAEGFTDCGYTAACASAMNASQVEFYVALCRAMLRASVAKKTPDACGM